MNSDKRQKRLSIAWAAMCLALVGSLFSVQVFGTDINKGYSWTPTDRVTSTKLNNEVDLATINTSFYTDKTIAAPVAADVILFFQQTSGVYRQATLQSLTLANTNLIVGQTEDTAPATNDFILTYDTSANSLKKVALYNAMPLARFNELTTPPDINYKLYIQDSTGVNYWTSMTNLLKNAYRHWQLANPSNAVSDPTNYFLSNNGSPIKTDAFVIWSGNTNKYTTLSNLVTQSTAATIATNGDFLWGYSTNDNQIVKVTIKQIQSFATNAANSPTLAQTNKLPQTYITNSIVLGNGLLVNGNHGLGGFPQVMRWVMVQTNASAQAGWGQGREVDIGNFYDSATGAPWFATSADNLGVIVVARNSGTMRVYNASSGTPTDVTQVNWNLKGYITYFPTFP